jgi:hypothetical protein
VLRYRNSNNLRIFNFGDWEARVRKGGRGKERVKLVPPGT